MGSSKAQSEFKFDLFDKLLAHGDGIFFEGFEKCLLWLSTKK